MRVEAYIIPLIIQGKEVASFKNKSQIILF